MRDWTSWWHGSQPGQGASRTARRLARRQARRQAADLAGTARLLAPRRGLLEAPIRDALLGAAGFSQLGQALAISHGPALSPRGRARFFPRLRQNIAVLHEAHRCIVQQEAHGRHVSPAGEWLLDNIHLVVAQTREVHDGLPRRYYRSLPVLADSALAGLPRIYAIAWAFVAHADSAFEPALLVDFLRAYQTVHPLTQGELWALPTTLRVVLVENLRRLAERVAADEAARETAHQLFDRLGEPAGHGPEAATALFQRLQQRGVQRAFALQVMQRLHADADSPGEPGAQQREAIRAALAQALPEPALAQAEQQADQAADNLSVGNAIRALQLLGSADWRDLISQVSLLMQRLLALPAFAAERDDTQDTTLHAIERLAKRCARPEAAVADVLLGLMPRTTPLAAPLPHPAGALADLSALSAQACPGYWLQGPGSAALQAALGLGATGGGPSWAERRRGLKLPLLLGLLGAGTLALTALVLARSALPGTNVWALLGLGLLALWPASEAVGAVLNRLVSESVPPRRLPRLALAEGIPAAHRVLVVLPALLTNSATISALAARLERHHLANREPQAQFALLTDHTDAHTPDTPADTALLALALAAINGLNLRHPSPLGDGVPRFLLLHRLRRWSDGEQRWIGWERKRGKLEQLVGLLAGDAATGPSPSPFVALGPLSQPRRGTRYLLTLDSDTILPPGALRELVGIAAHPLTQPVIGTTIWGVPRVVAGHAILQPRLAAAWPTPAQATGFHRLFAGSAGSDPYNAVASEVYQDLFDEGSFTGKGLLHVAALQAVLAGRLPEDLVLSHDLLEGCIARCGSVSDVALIEAAPDHADVAAARNHRWTRGDWQLLPLLRQARRYGLRGIDRWKLVDNLRRALVAPAALALLLLALAGAPLSPWGALVLAVLAFGAGPLVGAVAALAPSRDDLALRHFARQALAELGRALAGLAWQLALWWRQSLLLLDAIGRALWRTQVSHRSLLQWTTAAAAEDSAARGWQPLLRRHRGLSLGALALGAALLLMGTPHPGWVLLVSLLWAATPLWIAWASHTPAPAAVLPEPERQYLQAVAHDTWSWFALHVGTASHHLPPDNVQTVPRTIVAQRTSPTNIGLYLLAVASARAFGWIGVAEMAQRLQATLDTLDRLPRERGHFLNWIDTQTLQTLLPAYVSAVDSGNLCGHLLAVACACDEQGLDTLAARCRALAEAPDFGFLYDRRRRLLHIGWQVDAQQPDAGHYDLLASESRLASLWAIAKGDVPAAHWAALGRPFQASGLEVGLRSWSGSMFEYLMPTLVLAEPAGSALGCAGAMAVAEQRAWAAARQLPWGVSECAYAATDRGLAYQYAPQGVPRLALRRTPQDEQVVAPYATLLATMLAPRAAVANLRMLQGLQARGSWGFIEALDYTPSRQTDGSLCTPVCTSMAHHQGMALVALANVLLAGVAQRWGMADARMAAVATLLQERVPREVARLRDPALAAPRGPASSRALQPEREVEPAGQALQRTQLLSNGRYHVGLRANGAGHSRLGTVDIHRWRDDALRDAHGQFLYLQRAGQAAPVSLSQHPAPDPQAHYSAQFHSDRVCLDARWPDLRSRVTVWVSPEDDVELRQLVLWNTSSRPVTLSLMSAWEVSLSEARADEMHPAFANLFISAQWDAHDQALHLARRPRREGEPALHAVHFIAQADAAWHGVRVLADRSRWLGRRREAWQALADFDTAAHSADGSCPTGLDPVAALSLQITLPPHGTAQLTLATAAALERPALDALVDRYRQAPGVARSSQLSATLATLRQRELRLGADELVAVQTLATLMLLLHSRPAPPWAGSAQPPVDRRALWRYGLSGERPLVVVGVSTLAGMRLAKALVQALAYWSAGGLAVDLVLVNSEPHSYLQPLQQALLALQARHISDAGAEPAGCAGTLLLLRADDLNPQTQQTLAMLARLRLVADGRPLTQHVAELLDWHDSALAWRDAQDATPLGATGAELAGAGTTASAGWAGPARHAEPSGATGFDPVTGHYRLASSARSPTPRPWVNVLANPGFGALVSEAGAGCTWAGNSRLHQLTAWGNDALRDNQGETFCVQDLRSRAVWGLGTGAGQGGLATPHQVEHGPGRSSLAHQLGDLQAHTTWSVDPLLAVKRVHVRLHNQGSRNRPLRVAALLEWLLGAVRVDRQSLRTACISQPAGPAGAAGGAPTELALDILLATQLDDHDGAAGRTAFISARVDGAPDALLPDWTCDRRELYDSRGQPQLPDHLGQRAGEGGDPCAALSLRLRLAPGAQAGCVFVIGHAESPAAALALARASLGRPPAVAADAAQLHQQALLGAVQVATPDPLFDALVNHWLLHQTTACRLWGRAGFYQAGGAYGFRDQLQDTMALATTAPQLLREHLLRAAARQFVEGDVQHWWHPHSGAGVRTRFSDDRLWLPQATLHYVATTGDSAVWAETVPFIEADALAPEAEDAYGVPRLSAQQASLYEHCARALDVSLASGAHGLPLMGAGDWNDGMNRVGALGRGESVWLAWLLCEVVAGMAPLALQHAQPERAARWQAAADGWRQALAGPAWDGAWYLRAFFDDGTPLGGHARSEARIDLIAQAWSVLGTAGQATPQRQQQALASAQQALADPALGLLRLLDPPLQHAQPSAGYIQAYPPGVRENGGQYNHATVWACQAWARLGDGDAAWAAWVAASPAHRAAHPVLGPLYGLEPFAAAADVYSQPPWGGRGGWSWYTGTAALLHRAAVESICGLQAQAGRVRLQPALPGHWPAVQLTLRRDGRVHRFSLCAAGAVAAQATARSQGALPLAPGQWLDLAEAGPLSHHLLLCAPPLKPLPATPGPALAAATA